MKKTIIILLALTLLLGVAACTPKSTETTPANVAVLAGPTGVGAAYLMAEQADRYNVSLFTAPDQIVAQIVNGELDIAAVPVNLAATLYNKTEGNIVVLAVNTLGVLYFVTNNAEINSISDLAGKTVYSTGKGSTPQYVLEYLLDKEGLTDAVQVEYLSDNSDLIAKLADGSVEVALLPEPHVSIATAQSDTLRVAFSANDVWAKWNDTELVQGVYIARKDYAEAHPEVISAFLTDAKASADRMLTEEDAAAVVVAQGIIGKEAIAKKAIPNCNICLKTGDEMQQMVAAMLTVLFDANPQSVGGALPTDDFYYASAS